MYRRSERSKRPVLLVFGYPVVNNHSCLVYVNNAMIKFNKAFLICATCALLLLSLVSAKEIVVFCSILAISIVSTCFLV